MRKKTKQRKRRKKTKDAFFKAKKAQTVSV